MPNTLRGASPRTSPANSVHEDSCQLTTPGPHIHPGLLRYFIVKNAEFDKTLSPRHGHKKHANPTKLELTLHKFPQ